MNYTIEELLAVNIAYTIKDNEVGFTGLATGKAATSYITNIPLMGMELARRLHAPNLTILLCGWIHNPDISTLDAIPDAEFEDRLLDIKCEALMQDYPGTWAYKSGDIDFAFGSGVQVDREGNINCTCIGDINRPKVQLVGPIFITEHFAVFGREYIMMPYHEKRNFVKKVDHISGVGFPGGLEGRKQLRLPGAGPKYICTPKCIFAFNEQGEIYVKSIHEGIDKQDVIDSTGFEVGDLTDTPITPIPTPEELRLLREEIDPKGLLKQNIEQQGGR